MPAAITEMSRAPIVHIRNEDILSRFKVCIDGGGTFTDFFLVSDEGKAMMHKTLSTPEDPSIGFIKGIKDLAVKLNLDESTFFEKIDTIVHGTTVATNALLTRNGANTALITTKGFRDALEMRRGIREEQYNNHYQNIPPLVDRKNRLTIDERMDAQGHVIQPVSTEELNALVEVLKARKIKSVAVCFMNSYLNPENEKIVTEYLRKELPECFVTGSFEVLPSVRFYERVSTTVINAYIGIVVPEYLNVLTSKLQKHHFTGRLLIMQSNGGVVTPEEASKNPAVTVLSGPAAAPVGGAYFAGLLGFENCITMDMGGTSFDASLVVNAQCITSTEGSINQFRVALPTLDIITIGAGGGSIGWLDSGGLLQMGPQSAGAKPGPACYNLGGEQATCTDADLELGYLNPDFFAGGTMKLNAEDTTKCIHKKLGEPLKLSNTKVASGMYKIINMNMAQGVRQVSVERGYDPREFLMIVAGGAGAIHAGEICRELEIPMFIVPDVGPIFCAAGMLLGDLKHDFVKSYMTTFDKIDKEQLLSLYNDMMSRGKSTLLNEGIKEDNIRYNPILDLRYEGQYHEVSVEVPLSAILNFKLEKVSSLFHAEHNRLFGYSLEEEGTLLEVINVRLRAVGETDKPQSISANNNVSNEVNDAGIALKNFRKAYIPELDLIQKVPVYDGDALPGKCTIKGPAIIEQVNTSVFLGNTYNCQSGFYGALIVYDKEKFPNGISENAHEELMKVHEKAEV